MLRSAVARRCTYHRLMRKARLAHDHAAALDLRGQVQAASDTRRDANALRNVANKIAAEE